MRPELLQAVVEEALFPGRRRALVAATAIGVVGWGMAMRRFLGLERLPITETIGAELGAALDRAGLP